MTNLDDLPYEIIDLIMFHLSSIKDYAALSLQCRRLHDIVDYKTRRRYHTISIRRPHDVEYALKRLWEILETPKHRSYIRVVKMKYEPWTIPPSEQLAKYPADYRMETEDLVGMRRGTTIITAVKNAGYEGKEADAVIRIVLDTLDALKDNIASGQRQTAWSWSLIEPVIGAMLLSLGPNITLLKLNIQTYNKFLLTSFLRRANKRSSRQFLRNLRTVWIYEYDASVFGNPPYFAKHNISGITSFLHRLPSIESFGAAAIRCTSSCRSWMPYPRSSNITKLNFHHCMLHCSTLLSIIRQCKTLYEFSYSIGGRVCSSFPPFMPPYSTEFIYLEGLGRALRRHKRTLRLVDLDIDNCMIGDNGEPSSGEMEKDPEDSDAEDSKGDLSEPEDEIDYGGSIGSFHEFQHLTTLKIGTGALLVPSDSRHRRLRRIKQGPSLRLINILPRTLRTLTLRGYRQGWDKLHTRHVRELMKKKADRLPDLQTIDGVDEHIENLSLIYDRNGDMTKLWEYHESGDEDDRY